MQHMGKYQYGSARENGLRAKGAFTLIELLIVVAIIAILAAIAVPNFLEAQVRSKVARVKAEVRSIVTGLKAYIVDYNNYPGPEQQAPPFYRVYYTGETMYAITTPVAFMTSIPLDPFATGSFIYRREGQAGPLGELGPADAYPWKKTYHYLSYGRLSYLGEGLSSPVFCLQSLGPDQKYGVGVGTDPDSWVASQWLLEACIGPNAITWNQDPRLLGVIYDPTNGTRSAGDVHYIDGAQGVPNGFVGGA